MCSSFFSLLASFSSSFWTYFVIPCTVGMGLFLTIKTRGAQVFYLPKAVRIFYQESKKKHRKKEGVHPIHAFFASVGGCIGIGNLVAVCTAISIGGPGAVFWIWVAAFLGMILKYSEVYLGIFYRISTSSGEFRGGPMYYLQKAGSSRFLPFLFCFFLIIYGTEVYMFDVMTHTVVENWQMNRYLAIALFLILILVALRGGVDRVGKISTILLPLFLSLFCLMTGWVLYVHATSLPALFKTIFRSAFQGHAPLGGFAGSTMILSLSQGITRACYSADIGTGNASIIHAESRQSDPSKQACLSILGVFLDTFIVCTTTALLVLTTNIWQEPVPASMMVQKALSSYFPYMEYFIPLFLLILGYSSIISFAQVGLKCASFFHPVWGKRGYYLYATFAFIAFSFLDQSEALTLMSVTGSFLLCMNLWGIYKLHHLVWNKEPSLTLTTESLPCRE